MVVELAEKIFNEINMEKVKRIYLKNRYLNDGVKLKIVIPANLNNEQEIFDYIKNKKLLEIVEI